MRIVVEIDTGEADDGYEEHEIRNLIQHMDEIDECLRAGHYSINSYYETNESPDGR